MEDDKIRTLFDNFEPELSSSFQFMNQLKKNMDAVEIVKQHNIALKKRNRLAVVIAAVSGFVMGVILTLLFPLIGDWVSTFNISIPRLQISAITIDFSFFAWIVMAGVSIIAALNAYEIALAKLTPKESISLR
ncbi:MAG: hypothetical protein NC343_08555 [Muribaculum sp.]|nr:hypothetical protein [Muribaculum sp.]